MNRIHTFCEDSYVSYGWTPETPSSEQSSCLLVIIICELQNFEREIVQFKSCVFSLSMSLSLSLSLSLLPLSPCHHYFVKPRLWERGCYSSQGRQRHLRLKKTFKAWRRRESEKEGQKVVLRCWTTWTDRRNSHDNDGKDFCWLLSGTRLCCITRFCCIWKWQTSPPPSLPL